MSLPVSRFGVDQFSVLILVMSLPASTFGADLGDVVAACCLVVSLPGDVIADRRV